MSQPWVYMYSPFRSPALQGGSLPSKLPGKPIENRLANPGPQAGVIHLRIQVPNKKSDGGRNRVRIFTSTDFLLQFFWADDKSCSPYKPLSLPFSSVLIITLTPLSL